MSSPKQIVFTGLPGSGKSSVGQALANRLRLSFKDVDQVISQQLSMSIPQIFASRGEDGFRDLEVTVTRQILGSNTGVVSLGGGALTRAETRRALANKVVVFLDVSPQEAAARIGKDSKRPLLAGAGDTAAKIAKLHDERREAYLATATVTIVADGSIEEVAKAVIEALGLATDANTDCRYDLSSSQDLLPLKINNQRIIPVTSANGYEVTVGHGAIFRIREVLDNPAHKVFLLFPPPLSASARRLQNALTQAGHPVVMFEHPDGEGAKNIRVVEDVWRCLGENLFSREDAVVALGGGATTDMGGFGAATWLRGIDLINIPTSLLAMVDAAVGGKTGINTSVGKNLVGSFYPPRAVLCELDYLNSLPSRQLRAGLAEVIKCGFIADKLILKLLSENSVENLIRQPDVFEEVISRAISVKARVVSEDLKESGMRECLNYGHTLAHAIEKASSYQVLHGEAVAVGMAFASQVAQELGLLSAREGQAQRRQIAALGLPTCCPDYSFDQLVKIMASDKKVRGGVIRMVLTGSDGCVHVRPVRDYELLQTAFNAVNQNPSTSVPLKVVSK